MKISVVGFELRMAIALVVFMMATTVVTLVNADGILAMMATMLEMMRQPVRTDTDVGGDGEDDGHDDDGGGGNVGDCI